ncbi:MAG: hypothetical protein HGA45_38680 [Chloroflexales bacterium]|nr:hypothetical protein [Chloroflexales bacterium]
MPTPRTATSRPLGGTALLAEDEGRREADGEAVLAGLGMGARAEGLLALGLVDEALHRARCCEDLPGEHVRDLEPLAVARVLLARRRPEEALVRLRRLVTVAEGGGRIGYLIEGLVAQARALYDLRRLPEALAALRRALTLAEPEGYVQVFRDAGPAIATLLGRMRAEGERLNRYSAQLLAAFDAADTATVSPPHSLTLSLKDPLTGREQEVLCLLAEGATNQEIASALVVTVGTVKTHLNHILGKLGARNRTEAVARARALGLL